MSDSEPNPQRAEDEPDTSTFVVFEARPQIVQAINKEIPGVMVLHYEKRNVSMEVSGDVALRMITAFRRQRPDSLDDPVELGVTLAFAGYVTMALDGLLAITWQPEFDPVELVPVELLEALDEFDAAGADDGAPS